MSATSLSLQWSTLSFRDPQELYRSLRTAAFIRRIVSILTGRSRSLLDLTAEVSGRKIRNQFYAGTRTVPIDRIKGSEDRSDDFDCDFIPVHTHTFNRWISVATARSSEVILPAVELIQLGENYFVRDGHHRISVARAYGEKYIDAMVIVLELEPISGLLPASVVANPTYI